MLKIFLSSHGSMASGMQSSLKILMGECENLTVFDAYLDESCVQDHLDAFYETVGPEDEVLLCSDYLDRPNTRLVSGVNMSFMMNVLSEDTLSDERLDEIIEESREYLRRVEPEVPADTAPAGSDDFF